MCRRLWRVTKQACPPLPSIWSMLFSYLLFCPVGCKCAVIANVRCAVCFFWARPAFFCMLSWNQIVSTFTDAFQIRKCLGRLSWSQVSYFSESASTITCHNCPSLCAHCKRAAQVRWSSDFNLHPAWLRTGVEGPKFKTIWCSKSNPLHLATSATSGWEGHLFHAQENHWIPWLSRHTFS